jgi:hypothetical protein
VKVKKGKKLAKKEEYERKPILQVKSVLKLQKLAKDNKKDGSDNLTTRSRHLE